MKCTKHSAFKLFTLNDLEQIVAKYVCHTYKCVEQQAMFLPQFSWLVTLG